MVSIMIKVGRQVIKDMRKVEILGKGVAMNWLLALFVLR